jgi:hypothetical protein
MTRSFKFIQKQKFQDPPISEDDDQKKVDPPNEDPGNKPSDKEAELLKEVMKRKGNEQTLKTEVTTLKEQLAKFSGIDVDQVRVLLQEKADRETAELEARGEFDRVKEQMRSAHSTELTTIKSTLETQVGELSGKLSAAQSVITDLTIGRSFSDSTFVRETLTLPPAKARQVFGSHFELQDGNVVAYDKPAGSHQRTVLVDGAGAPLPFDKAIEKIVQADSDADHLIRSKVKPGAHSKNEPDAKRVQQVGSGRDRIAAAVKGGGLQLPK